MNRTSSIGSLFNHLCAQIGAANVTIDESQIELRSRTCIPYRELPQIIVYPLNAQHVQAVVLAAQEFNVPVWPVSTGKNWGYGETTACYPGGITMILNRMTKIWHVDEKLGYAVIDPGVTYQQLNDYLKANKIPLWTDVTSSTQSGSVIGNALDKGRGLSPYADHFGQICGMDVVLSDGKILETGNVSQGNYHSRHLYKWGIGPSLQGLFAQSNFGIVVKAGVWLMPEPEGFDWAVFDYTAKEEQFGDFIDDLRKLMFQGALRAYPHVANDFAMLCNVSQYPHERLAGQKFLSPAALESWRKEHGVAPWSFSCGLYGLKKEVRIQKYYLRRVLSQYGQIQFLGAAAQNTLYGKTVHFFAKGMGKMLGKSPALMASLIPAINLYRGVPTDYFVKQIYAKAFASKPAEKIVDAAKDQCGVLWLGPLIPFTCEHVTKAIAISKDITAKHEFDFFLEIIVESPRNVIFLLGVFYDRKADEECSRAKRWYTEVKTALSQNGYPTYRMATMSMPDSSDTASTQKDFLNAIKQSIDPQNIIAPGRYGISANKKG